MGFPRSSLTFEFRIHNNDKRTVVHNVGTDSQNPLLLYKANKLRVLMTLQKSSGFILMALHCLQTLKQFKYFSCLSYNLK